MFYNAAFHEQNKKQKAIEIGTTGGETLRYSTFTLVVTDPVGSGDMGMCVCV